MACGACSSRSRVRSGTARTLYKVVLDGPPERVAFQTHDPTMAKTVARNYPGSRVAPDPDATTTDTEKTGQESAEEPESGSEPVETGEPS
jgi:hypothetical protein